MISTPKKKTNKDWIEELDILWSKKIRSRDGKCLKCGKTEYLQAHHIFRRNKRNTRWALENGTTFCYGCHNWWHANPIEATHWIESKMGKTRLSNLEEKSKILTGSWTAIDFKKVESKLKL